MLTPHPYRGEQDLSALQDLLRAGLMADPRLTYAHPGDIEWWFYYNPSLPPPEQSASLWRTEAGDLAVWSLLENQTFNLFVHPAYRTEALFDEMLAWLDGELSRRPSETSEVMCERCARADEMYKAALGRAGYTAAPYLALFEQDLTATLPPPVLPQGFRFLETMEDRYIDTRAGAHYSAFSRTRPSKMTPERYRLFMTAPSYDPTLDISIVNAADEVVAFAMAWADSVTQRAEFEPVGTHKEYQRRGLGRAALQEGLRRLQARGITIANVMTPAEDADNTAFYLSAGFQVVEYSDHYKKAL
jgi:mycothiol synthase